VAIGPLTQFRRTQNPSRPAVARPYAIRTPDSAPEVVGTKEVAFESHRERIRYGRHLDAIQFRHSSGDRREPAIEVGV